MYPRILVACAALFLLAPPSALAGHAGEKTPVPLRQKAAPDPIDALIDAMDSPTFRVREAALAALVKKGVAAIPKLFDARVGSRPEVASRATTALKEIFRGRPLDWTTLVCAMYRLGHGLAQSPSALGQLRTMTDALRKSPGYDEGMKALRALTKYEDDNPPDPKEFFEVPLAKEQKAILGKLEEAMRRSLEDAGFKVLEVELERRTLGTHWRKNGLVNPNWRIKVVQGDADFRINGNPWTHLYTSGGHPDFLYPSALFSEDAPLPNGKTLRTMQLEPLQLTPSLETEGKTGRETLGSEIRRPVPGGYRLQHWTSLGGDVLAYLTDLLPEAERAGLPTLATLPAHCREAARASYVAPPRD